MIIERGDLAAVQEIFSELWEVQDEFDMASLFKDCYLHACLKKKKEIADWFTAEFERLDPIMKIALRQMFPYGRHLLAK